MTEEKKPNEVTTVVVQNDPIEINDGEINAKSLQQLNRACQYLAKSGMLPKQFDTPEKTAVGMLMCKELGLKSIISLRNIAVINGSPTLWGELPLALVRKSGRLKYFNEYLIDANYNKICMENKNLTADIFAAICEIQREGYERKSYAYTKIDMEKNPNSKNQVWTSYKSIMMKRKARSLAIKDEFGDLLGGASIAEYDHDIIPVEGNNETRRVANVRESTNEKTSAIQEKLLRRSKGTPPSVSPHIESEDDGSGMEPPRFEIRDPEER